MAGHVSQTKEYTSHGPILGRRKMADMVCPPTTSSSGAIRSLRLLCDAFSAMLTTQQPPPWPDRSCHRSAALWRQGFEEASFPLWDHVNKGRRLLSFFFFSDSHSGVAPEFGGQDNSNDSSCRVWTRIPHRLVTGRLGV